MQQKPVVMDIFPILLNKINPLRVIEIGTGQGGLSMFIKDNLKLNVEFYTFDINELKYHSGLIENGIKVVYKNIFIDEVNNYNSYNVKQEWEEIFKITPKLVICDGGNKKAEFNCLAKYLNQGDIIMLHDYSTNRETFEKLNVWNWLECQYSDIQSSCENYNLQPYMHDVFLNVAWGCFIKQ